MKKGFIHIILAFVLVLISCERLVMQPIEEPSYRENFEHLWRTLDQKYSFFQDKSINWDSVYLVYDKEIDDVKSTIQLFNLMTEMMSILEDGHVNLSAGFDLGRNWDWYLNFPSNFNFDNIERNYLTNPQRATDYQISGPVHNALFGSTGYWYYDSFSKTVNESLLNYLVRKLSSRTANSANVVANGLIIDVRNNGGGRVNNAFNIANRFATDKIHVADWYYKNGPDHDDFTAPVKKFIAFEGDEDFKFSKPIVILTNRSCYSATNMFISMMKQLPNVTVIGDRSGGGGGLPINDELPNGWVYRFSSTRTIDPQGNNIEFGVEPDIYLEMTQNDIANGVDPLIEAAIQFINNQN